MPIKMEKSLEHGAIKHGFKPGSKRYNAYVYGTMYKNHAGWLGPDRALEGIGNRNKMSRTNILYGFHVAAVAIGIIALWVLFGSLGGNAGISRHITSFYDPMENIPSWSAFQRNSYGAYAGIREGEAN